MVSSTSSTSTPHHCSQALTAHVPFGICESLKPKTNIGWRRRFIIRKTMESKKKWMVYIIENFSKTRLGDFKKSVKSETDRKSGEETETAPELPFDVISEEILVRLPIKSLVRFKCVAKQWRSLIEDRGFIKKQMDRSAPVLVRDCDELSASAVPSPSSFNSEGCWAYEIIGVFNGLVVQRIWDKYFVKNPATMQTLPLPEPLGRCHRMWFDLDPCSGDPKLLCEYRVTEGDSAEEKRYQILTIGKDEHWRDLETPRGENLLMALGAQNMHFLGLVRTGRDVELQVSSFDIRSERFTCNDFPCGLFSDLSKAFPFWWEKSLAVAEFTVDKLHVAVLERHGGIATRYRWSTPREVVVVPLSFLRERIYSEEKIVPVSSVSDDFWFLYGGVCRFSYDMKAGRVKERVILANEKRRVTTFEYRPSLESLKGMRPATQILA